MGKGRETFYRLLNWDKGHEASERLTAVILSKGRFKEIDPSHPLGGKGDLKDITISFNER